MFFEILTGITSSWDSYFFFNECILGMPSVCWCSGMRRAVQDNNQSTDGPLTYPYVIRLFSRSFQKISHLLLIILAAAQCIRVRGIGTDLSSCMTHCMHLFFSWCLRKMSACSITKEKQNLSLICASCVLSDCAVGLVKLNLSFKYL